MIHKTGEGFWGLMNLSSDSSAISLLGEMTVPNYRRGKAALHRCISPFDMPLLMELEAQECHCIAPLHCHHAPC